MDEIQMGDDKAGYLSRLVTGLAHPFHADMTWTQLFLVVGFVLLALLAWRQVVNFIVAE